MTQERSSPLEPTDIQLIARFTKGDKIAFEMLVQRHERAVFNLARKFTRDLQDTEEVVQDVFLSLYRKAIGFEGKAQFTSWLYRVTVNAAFMKLRRRKNDWMIKFDDLKPGAREEAMETPDDRLFTRADLQAQSTELRTRLERGIRNLPDQYRDVFMLRDVDGLSNEEASAVLDITVAAVKSRLHRARALLRRRLINPSSEDCLAFSTTETKPDSKDLRPVSKAA